MLVHRQQNGTTVLERERYLGLGLGSLDTVLSDELVGLRESQSLGLQQVLQAVLLTLNNTVAGTQMSF